MWIKCREKAVLYALDKNSFNYGTLLLLKGRPSFLQNQKNPHAFDYALFLQRKGIYLQAFCQQGNYKFAGEDHSPYFKYGILSVGDFFEDLLIKNIKNERELNIIKAMVIGRRNEVTPEMEYVYEATGTSHILAVSGLHIGIIFLVAKFIFGIAKRRGLKWLYYCAIILSIWIFATITGLSPSVFRASLMLSFLLGAEMLQRRSNIYNSILSSAFCILLVSPNLIYSVSFQFSYMAVLGIVYLYKMIYTLIYVENRILNFFWQITALSFSVQIATFPINIHYFHHFPALFPLTNLVAIPAATAIVIGSLLLFMTSFIKPLVSVVAFVLERIVFIYNEIMVQISSWTIASIDDLSLKGIYVFLLLALTFLLVRFIELRRIRFFAAFTLLLVFTSIYIFIDHLSKATQKQVNVYAVKNCTYIDVFHGNTCYSNIKSLNEQEKRDTYYNVKPNRQHHQISVVKSLSELSNSGAIGKNPVFVLDGKSFLLLKEPISLLRMQSVVYFDFVIVGKSSLFLLNNILDRISVNHLIVDGSVSEFDLEKLTLTKHVHKTHAVIQQGAFVISI
jgi:competence protein ComEC